MTKLSSLLVILYFYTAQLSEATKEIFQVKLGELETLINTGQFETLSIVLANDGAMVSNCLYNETLYLVYEFKSEDV